MRIPLLFAAVTLVSCTHLTPPDLDSLEATLQELEESIDRHCSAEMPADRQSCEAALSAHAERMRGPVEALEEHAPGFDECMNLMGHHPEADLRETCGVVRVALEEHRQRGCLPDSRDAWGAERQQHCESMRGDLQRARQRTSMMRGMMRRGGMMSHGRCERH